MRSSRVAFGLAEDVDQRSIWLLRTSEARVEIRDGMVLLFRHRCKAEVMVEATITGTASRLLVLLHPHHITDQVRRMAQADKVLGMHKGGFIV